MVRLPKTRLGMASYILSIAIVTFALFSTANAPLPEKQAYAPSPSPLANTNNDTTVLGDTDELTYLVTRVIDGDTFQIEDGNIVRMIGIDTPESVAPGKKVACFALEASLKTKELLEGSRVRLVKDISDKDWFGRLLRYVYVDDMFVNKILAWEGYARVKKYPPDTLLHSELKAAEEAAFKEQKGLWGPACQV